MVVADTLTLLITSAAVWSIYDTMDAELRCYVIYGVI